MLEEQAQCYGQGLGDSLRDGVCCLCVLGNPLAFCLLSSASLMHSWVSLAASPASLGTGIAVIQSFALGCSWPGCVSHEPLGLQ